MAHKTLKGGTAYEIIGGRTLIGGTGYDIAKGRTLKGGTGYDIPFSKGIRIGDLPVGTKVYFATQRYGGTECIITHQGKPSSLYDDSCDGTWLTRADNNTAIGGYVLPSTGIYANSTVHRYLNSSDDGFISNGIIFIESGDAIKTVKIPYVATPSGGVYSGEDGLTVRAFLLSAREVGFTTSDLSTLREDGACLDYYKGKGPDGRLRKADGSYMPWHLRTPNYQMRGWHYVSDTGNLAQANGQVSANVFFNVIVDSDTLMVPDPGMANVYLRA